MAFVERRGDLAAVGALAAILTILFADVLFLGNELYFRDLALQYYPARRVLHDIVAGGHFPFWNPRLSGGQPLAAQPAYETFYPFQWLIFLPDFDLGFRWTIVLHFYIAALGMYALLRSLHLRIPAAMFGTLSFVLGGMFLSLTNLLPFLFSAAWLPWIGLFWRRWLRTRGISDLILAALALAMLLLAADESMILQAGALLSAYGLYRFLRHGAPARTAASVGVVIALASAVASVQLFPALDLKAHSGRAAALPWASASSWSLSPERPFELLFPNLEAFYSPVLPLVWSRAKHAGFPFSFILSTYPGLLAGVLMLAGFIRRVRGWKFAAACAAISYLLALGERGLLFRLAYAAGLRSLRYPEKFVVSGVFVLTIFAAIAADEFDRDAALRRVCAIICAVIAATSIALYAYAFAPSFPETFAAMWSETNPLLFAAWQEGCLLSAITAAALTCVLLAYRRLGRHAVALLAIFVLVDLGARMDGLAPRFRSSYFAPPPAARALTSRHEPVRIYNDVVASRTHVSLASAPPVARVWANRNGMIPRMEEIWGFEGAFEPDLDLMTLANTRELMGVAHEVAKTRPDRIPLLLSMAGVTDLALLDDSHVEFRPGEDPEKYNYTRFAPFPRSARFRFADALIAVRPGTAAQTFERAAVTPASAFIEFPAFVPHPGRILAVDEEPSHLAFDVLCEGTAFLTIAITADPHWHATIDGRPATLQRANIGFQGVIVTAGRHRIEMQYSNPLITRFGIVSLISALALVAVALRSRAPQPRSQH